MSKPKETYTVNVVDRIRDLCEFLDVGPEDHFSYSWYHGYEKYEIRYGKGGSSTYGGSYHPDVICETFNGESSGICAWCGSTLF